LVIAWEKRLCRTVKGKGGEGTIRTVGGKGGDPIRITLELFLDFGRGYEGNSQKKKKVSGRVSPRVNPTQVYVTSTSKKEPSFLYGAGVL